MLYERTRIAHFSNVAGCKIYGYLWVFDYFDGKTNANERNASCRIFMTDECPAFQNTKYKRQQRRQCGPCETHEINLNIVENTRKCILFNRIANESDRGRSKERSGEREGE